MKKSGKTGSEVYESYPLRIVAVATAASLAIYFLGALIVSRVGVVWLALYLLCIVILEARLIGGHCVNCYYYGKTCAFGKGRLSCALFKRGFPKRFARMKVSWIDILPDFLVPLVPVALGIAMLAAFFEWWLAAAVVLLLILTFAGSAFVRSELACAHCRQRKLGCPAQKLFEKKK